MKVWLVVDHQIEADIPIGVFSDKESAERFVKENCWPICKEYKYDQLFAHEFEIDELTKEKLTT